MTLASHAWRRTADGLRLAVVSFAFAACATVAPRRAADSSLYARLGGYDAIAALTADLVGREMADPRIAPFFKGLETRDLQRIQQHIADQLCSATGGPCFYPGKDMKTAHAEMEITPDIFNAFTSHIDESLAKFKVGERERNELVAIIASLKGAIVNR